MDTNITRHALMIELAREGHGAPDCMEAGKLSAGADYLDTVAACVIEAIEYGRFGEDSTEDRVEVVDEIAGGSLPTATHEMWSAFVDLCAYAEDIDDGLGITDMGDRARYALSEIARRGITNWLESDFDA